MATTSPYPPSSRLTLLPVKGVPPIFFYQNDRKGWTLNYLVGLGHVLFGLGATGKKSRGMVTTPLPLGRMRVKTNEELIIVVEDDLSDVFWNMILFQGELYEIVWHSSFSIL